MELALSAAWISALVWSAASDALAGGVAWICLNLVCSSRQA